MTLNAPADERISLRRETAPSDGHLDGELARGDCDVVHRRKWLHTASSAPKAPRLASGSAAVRLAAGLLWLRPGISLRPAAGPRMALMNIWSSVGLVAALVQLATMAVQYANTRSIGILCCLVRRAGSSCRADGLTRMDRGTRAAYAPPPIGHCLHSRRCHVRCRSPPRCTAARTSSTGGTCGGRRRRLRPPPKPPSTSSSPTSSSRRGTSGSA